MADKHRFDLPVTIIFESLRNLGRLCHALHSKIEQLYANSHTARHLGPTMPETSRCCHQDFIPRLGNIGQCGLPCAMSIGNINRHMLGAAGHPFQILNNAFCQID